MDVAKENEEYWSTAITDFMKLGMNEALVPIDSFSYDIAKTIALKLDLTVEVIGGNYVFRKAAADSGKVRDNE